MRRRAAGQLSRRAPSTSHTRPVKASIHGPPSGIFRPPRVSSKSLGFDVTHGLLSLATYLSSSFPSHARGSFASVPSFGSSFIPPCYPPTPPPHGTSPRATGLHPHLPPHRHRSASSDTLHPDRGRLLAFSSFFLPFSPRGDPSVPRALVRPGACVGMDAGAAAKVRDTLNIAYGPCFFTPVWRYI